MEARILIADQNPAVTLVMRRHFESAGHEVDVAHDGLDALEMGSSGIYDLAFIDHFLPTMLGAEVIQTWTENGVDLPTIIVSTLNDESMIVRCLELGAADFIRKPFNTAELDARAQIHLTARHEVDRHDHP
jgi:DNA-binding response OmpR family regulator